MGTSATGCFDCLVSGRGAGFTLLELLVVMVIISAVLSTVVLSIRPDPRSIVREEGDRLAALLGLASDEAAMGGAPLAWVGRESGYEFQQRGLTDLGPDWTLLRSDDLLHERQLPDGVRIRGVLVDGQPLESGQRVVLGHPGVQDLTVELVYEEAHARVIGQNGRFATAPGAGP